MHIVTRGEERDPLRLRQIARQRGALLAAAVAAESKGRILLETRPFLRCHPNWSSVACDVNVRDVGCHRFRRAIKLCLFLQAAALGCLSGRICSYLAEASSMSYEFRSFPTTRANTTEGLLPPKLMLRAGNQHKAGPA